MTVIGIIATVDLGSVKGVSPIVDVSSENDVATQARPQPDFRSLCF